MKIVSTVYSTKEESENFPKYIELANSDIRDFNSDNPKIVHIKFNSLKLQFEKYETILKSSLSDLEWKNFLELLNHQAIKLSNSF